MEKAWIYLIAIPVMSFGQTNTFPSSGNVGIGTLSPEAGLKVVRSSNIGGKWNPNSSIFTIAEAGNSLIMDTNEIYGSKALYIGSKSGDIVRFRTVTDTNVSDKVVISSDGYMGIGTSTPTRRLTIAGNELTEPSLLIRNTSYNSTNSSGNVSLQFAFANHVGPKIEAFKTSTNITGLKFYGEYGFNSPQLMMTIIPSEFGPRMGIGTSNPDAGLTVKGKIHAEEVKIDLSVPAADYVFKDDYKLRSIEEVRQYIQKHGHLPNIPSAREMEENGVELGVMNMKLLEKMEELTLYVIELKKMNDNQQMQIEKNTSLKKEMALLQVQNTELAKRLKALEKR